ncbi:MAG: DUF2878 domain-containing protein [Pseudomonadota bacterium]
MPRLAKNLILFKAGWLACVLGAANGMPWLGPLAVLVVAAEHLRSAKAPLEELKLLGLAAAIGTVWESVLVVTNLLDYGTSSNLAPYWIIAMWVLFATTLNIGMNWLKRHWIIAMIAGGVGGPLAFFSGSKAGAVTFVEGTNSLIAIGVGWALLLPVLVIASKRLNGHSDSVPLSLQRA